MNVHVTLERQRKKQDVILPVKATVAVLLQELKINPVTVLVTIDHDVVIDDYVLKDGQDVVIRSVVSGG